MVRTAYSSGKPAFGVGPGNVQCLIDRDADLAQAIPKIITGRCFDNGIICSGEQSVILPEEMLDDALEVFAANGAYYISEKDEVDAVRRILFPSGQMNKNLVGRSAADVAEAAGVEVPEGTRMLLVRAAGCGYKAVLHEEGGRATELIRQAGYAADDDLAKEKMAPVQALYVYKEWEQALYLWKGAALDDSSLRGGQRSKEYARKLGSVTSLSPKEKRLSSGRKVLSISSHDFAIGRRLFLRRL
jgi:succinate-semialdehyde dehydrogenase